MMMRTQRIRRISPATRRPQARRAADQTRRSRRLTPPPAAARRGTGAERRGTAPARPSTSAPAATPVKQRRRPRHLRLVAFNARPRWRRPLPPPVLRLVRGRAPSLALPRARRIAAATARPTRPAVRQSRAAQLLFVAAMAAVGLVALATSIGQVVTSGM